MKKDKIIFLIAHLMIIVFIFLTKNLITFKNGQQEMKFLEGMLMVIYIYVFATAKIYLNWLNSYMIFLYTTFLFNYSRIFLDIVNYHEFGWATKFANYYFYHDVRN